MTNACNFNHWDYSPPCRSLSAEDCDKKEHKALFPIESSAERLQRGRICLVEFKVIPLYLEFEIYEKKTHLCHLSTNRYALRVMRYALRVTRYALRVTRYALCVTRYALCVMRYALCVMRYALCDTRSAILIILLVPPFPVSVINKDVHDDV